MADRTPHPSSPDAADRTDAESPKSDQWRLGNAPTAGSGSSSGKDAHPTDEAITRATAALGSDDEDHESHG